MVSCTTVAGTGNSPEQTFQCVASGSSHNKGFVVPGPDNYLRFGTGDPFIPVGENIGWPNGNPYIDYKNWIGKLSDNGGNFFRMWHCSWGLGIEWKNGANGYEGLRRYKQINAFYQDWLFDFCAEKGIYLMLCLHHHGQVSSQVNPEWSASPYNAANGGPCQQTWDFFTHPAARNHVKNRLRYVVARWGYARSIAVWELFNEVDWTDQFDQRKNDVAAWHAEMAAFLKTTDPYKHLVTSSYAHEHNDPSVWVQPHIDFTQTHFYVNTPHLERVLAGGTRNYLLDFGKPSLNGEFGLGPDGSSLPALDPDGIHIHNALWGSLFGGGMGSGMSWWWDSYIDPKNLYQYLAPVAEISQRIPFHTSHFTPTTAIVSGVPGDLSLIPALQAWGALADTAFTIDATGAVSPAGAELAAFLYGAQWNTQYRRPPVFYVQYPVAGQFSVKTSGQSGQSPKIAIWLDGVKKLEQQAGINQTYTIDVPAGQHTIRVDNTGTDWILVAAYVFTGLGSAADAYILKAENNNHVVGWILNSRYNHEYIVPGGLPPVVKNAVLTVPGVQNGSYFVKYYDCLTGGLYQQEQVTAAGGKLVLALPELTWDMVLLVEEQSADVAEVARHTGMRLFPNPVESGHLTLWLPLDNAEELSVTLLDMAGRTLENLFSGPFSGGEKRLFIGETYPAGLYWLRVETSGKLCAKPVVIVR
jgi:hypothetical protein